MCVQTNASIVNIPIQQKRIYTSKYGHEDRNDDDDKQHVASVCLRFILRSSRNRVTR